MVRKKPVTTAEIQARKEEIMEQCFECYADNGFHGTGIKSLAKYCGCTSANLYTYFDNIDDLIIQSTAFCLKKIEDDFMAKAPTDIAKLYDFIDEVPYWTAEKHGKKYRLMYQIYTHPKFMTYGKSFFDDVNERYTDYAKILQTQYGIPYEKMLAFIFILVRACVHYALFNDEFYLKTQLDLLKEVLAQYITKYNPKAKTNILGK